MEMLIEFFCVMLRDYGYYISPTRRFRYFWRGVPLKKTPEHYAAVLVIADILLWFSLLLALFFPF